MNRYNLTHRSETEHTAQLSYFMNCFEGTAKAFYKVLHAFQLSNSSKLYLLDSGDFSICSVEDLKVGVGFKLGSMKDHSQPAFTMRIPLEKVVTYSQQELSQFIDSQLKVAQNNYDSISKVNAEKPTTGTGMFMSNPTTRMGGRIRN